MMTPFHTDLMKYSTPVAPTTHERQAMRSLRQVRRVALSALKKRVLSHVPSFPVAAKRSRANTES